MIESAPPALNSTSILSFVLGLLTLFSSCIGMFPIPLTGFVCFPAAILLGLLSVTLGAASLIRIRARAERGAAFAWIGIFIGGLALLAFLCFIAVIVSLFMFLPTYPWPIPPNFNYFQT